MGSHRVVDLHPAYAVAVNGHEPMIVHNVTTRVMRMACDTCNWMSQSRKGRWQDKVEDDWRTHAGDIAVGVTITHGEVGNGCYCASCAMATRQAKASSP